MSFRLGSLLVLALLLLDQASKWSVENFLPLRQPIDLLPVLALYHTHNTGIAFSMLDGVNGAVLSALSIGIAALVLFFWLRTPGDRRLLHWGYALIIAGALGNLIDRVLLGHVVDFILFHVGDWSFAVFNLADSFITVGAAAVVLGEFLEKPAAATAAAKARPGED